MRAFLSFASIQARTGQDLAILTYREGPLATSQTSVVRDRLIPNGTKKHHPTVARGPVPRTDRRMRGTGPRTTVTGNRFL